MSRFPNIDWFCDGCGALLNSQEDFDDSHYVWRCTECGYKSSISRDCIDWDSVDDATKDLLGYDGN